MTPEEAYLIWAPPRAAWSPWVKPVLFAHLPAPPVQPTTAENADLSGIAADMSWAPAATGNRDTSIVVDLPGVEAMDLGLLLARRGFRPVPLFNAAPAAGAGSLGDGASALVSVWPVVRRLETATAELAALPLSDDASPVFLLDADRRGGPVAPGPGLFDNRSISFPTDFPSAMTLHAGGIRQVVLVQRSSGQPQADLAHTLRRWQDAGIALTCKTLGAPEGPMALKVNRPSQFRWVWYQALSLLGMRRHVLGGFGGLLPQPSSG